jgi:hypothetical protein
MNKENKNFSRKNDGISFIPSLFERSGNNVTGLNPKVKIRRTALCDTCPGKPEHGPIDSRI